MGNFLSPQIFHCCGTYPANSRGGQHVFPLGSEVSVLHGEDIAKQSDTPQVARHRKRGGVGACIYAGIFFVVVVRCYRLYTEGLLHFANSLSN